MRFLDTSVKYFDKQTYNIPVLDATWGCLITFLDEVLINGTQPQNILQITSSSLEEEDYWLFNIDLNIGHGFKENLSVVEIKECSDATFNKVFRVQSTTDTSITIAFLKSDVPIKPENILETTSASINCPPLGFEKTFEGLQKAVYKVTTKEGKKCFLRVDNSCPVGHDPAHAKFARVSMFENMEHIDDYEYKTDVRKCPCYDYNPNVVEEDIQNMWFTSSQYNDTSMDLKYRYNITLDYSFFGDSTFFYMYIKSLRIPSTTNSTGSSARDEVYFFGEYIKTIYKEDPLPFALRCSTKYTSTTALDKNNHRNLLKSASDNYTFSTENYSLTKILAHNKLYNLQINYAPSSTHTSLSYVIYKNQMNISTFKLPFLFIRDSFNIIEGYLPGYTLVATNLRQSPLDIPLSATPFILNNWGFLLEFSDYQTNRDRTDVDRIFMDLEGWRDDGMVSNRH